jgi:hypothetical protein
LPRGKGATAMKIRTKRGIENVWLVRTEILKKNYNLIMEIVSQAYRLCQEGFVRDGSEEFKEDVSHHVREEEKVCLLFEDQRKRLDYAGVISNRIRAFASYRIMEMDKERVLYISAMVVSPSIQRMHVASALMGCIAIKEQATKIALRTQNPVMCKSISKTCAAIYPPVFSEGDIPQDILSLGEEIARELGMKNYQRELMTEKGTYGGHSLYGKKPKLEDPRQNERIAERIMIDNGDSMIIIGVLD